MGYRLQDFLNDRAGKGYRHRVVDGKHQVLKDGELLATAEDKEALVTTLLSQEYAERKLRLEKRHEPKPKRKGQGVKMKVQPGDTA